MKQKMTSISSRFFKSMALLSTIFIMFFLIVTSLLFYKHFIDLETASSLRQLEYISHQCEYYLTSVDNYSKTIMINNNVQQYVAKYNNQNRVFTGIDQLNIKNEINGIIQSTPFIHSVSLYAPNGELVATTELFPYKVGLENLPTFDQAIWAPRNKYSNNNREKTISTLSLIRPFYNYSTGSLLGYMEIALPESTISDIYQNKSTNFSKIFITNKFGTVQSTDGSKPLAKKYNNFEQVIVPYASNYQFIYNKIVFSKYFPSLDWYIINEINLLNFLEPTFKSFVFFIGLTLLSILASLYVSHKVSRSITAPIYQLIEHTQKIKKGNWTPVEGSYHDSDIGLLFEEFNSMIVAQEVLKNDLVSVQKMKSKISLDLLQQQVNPHFLYNTLDNICSLAEIGENDMVIDLVMHLATFYREGLSNGRTHIAIKNELDITRAYLHIMQVRYYHKLDFNITYDEDLLDATCLKLLLQPIVENSIYHGIKELEGNGFIDIHIFEKENGIVFTVQDNGVGLSPESYDKIWGHDRDHFGLKNIHQRIQLYYGDEYGLTIENHPQGGCITTLIIGKKEG